MCDLSFYNFGNFRIFGGLQVNYFKDSVQEKQMDLTTIFLVDVLNSYIGLLYSHTLIE